MKGKDGINSENDLLDEKGEEGMGLRVQGEQLISKSDLRNNEISEIEGFERVAVDQRKYEEDDERLLSHVDLRLFIKGNRILSLSMDIPEYYPNEPIHFTAGSRIGID